MRHGIAAFIAALLGAILLIGLKGAGPYYVVKNYNLTGKIPTYEEMGGYEAYLFKIDPPIVTLFGITLVDKRTPTMWQREKLVYDQVGQHLLQIQLVIVAICVLVAIGLSRFMLWFNNKYQWIRPPN